VKSLIAWFKRRSRVPAQPARSKSSAGWVHPAATSDFMMNSAPEVDKPQEQFQHSQQAIPDSSWQPPACDTSYVDNSSSSSPTISCDAPQSYSSPDSF